MTNFTTLQKDVSKIYRQSEDLGVNVPQIMQKRINMMAQQNPFDNHKERVEMERMVNEKTSAFMESWQNMGWQSLIAQQNIGNIMIDSWIKLSFGKPVAFEKLFYQINLETLKIFEKGMSPIHRRVVANAKRLA